MLWLNFRLARVVDCGFEVREFKLQLHFLINGLGKGMNPLIPSSYRLNSIIAFLL